MIEAMHDTLRRPIRQIRQGWRRGFDRRRRAGPPTFRETRRDHDEVAGRCAEIEAEIEQLEGLIVSVPVALERRRCLFRDMLPPPDSAAGGGAGGRYAHAQLHERRQHRLSRGRRRLRTRRRLTAIVASGVVLGGLVLVAAGVYYLIVTRV